MFDLEKAIAEWRRDLIAGGVKQPEILDELESHLRDDLSRQTHGGLDVRQDFEAAVLRIGRAPVLQKEFKKIGSIRRLTVRATRHALAFAGVPNECLEASMSNQSNFESRRATYLRSTAFLLPAICLWMFSTIYVVPAFKVILSRTDISYVGWLIHVNRVNFAVMDLFKDHFFWIICAAGLALGLLEWRSDRWPRFRRAILGTGVFLLNLAVLLSFFIMFIAATVAAGLLSQHAK